jgi:hypothetical protein
MIMFGSFLKSASTVKIIYVHNFILSVQTKEGSVREIVGLVAGLELSIYSKRLFNIFAWLWKGDIRFLRNVFNYLAVNKAFYTTRPYC